MNLESYIKGVIDIWNVSCIGLGSRLIGIGDIAVGSVLLVSIMNFAKMMMY